MAKIEGDATANNPKTGFDGTPDNDEMYGYGGPDRLFGRLGDDKLFGGVGQDYLVGGLGLDRLWGDPVDPNLPRSTDTFAFFRYEKGVADVDVVMDYKDGEDKIELNDFGFDIDTVNGGMYADDFDRLMERAKQVDGDKDGAVDDVVFKLKNGQDVDGNKVFEFIKFLDVSKSVFDPTDFI